MTTTKTSKAVIKIEDHDTSVGSRRSNYRFNITFTVGNEGAHDFTRNKCADFSDIASFLCEKGHIDSFEANNNNGMIYVEDEGREFWTDSYTFNDYISGFFGSVASDKVLSEFIREELKKVK